jgi:hypothetical protein
MKRKTFDMILTAGGAALVVILVAAGSLGLWAHSYASSNVHNQLAAQQIYFPPQAAFAHPKAGTEITPSMIPSVSQYAGQQLLNGAQAEVYADDFISVHLSAMPYHGVYAAVSTAARAATPGTPQAAKLQALEATTFQGTTLRGLLLEAYAFWTFGQIALWAAVIAFILAGLMLLLTMLGAWHLRRVPAEEEFPRSARHSVGAVATV